MFVSLHIGFRLERAAVVHAIMNGISGMDPSLEMTDPIYLKLLWSLSAQLIIFSRKILKKV